MQESLPPPRPSPPKEEQVNIEISPPKPVPSAKKREIDEELADVVPDNLRAGKANKNKSVASAGRIRRNLPSNFSPARSPNKRLNHYQISKNINPFSAMEQAILRASK